MTDMQDRIAQIIRQADGDHTMGAAALAEVLVSELGLREISTAGYLDAEGYLLSWQPRQRAEFKKYTQYISGFHEVDGED